MKSTRHHSSHSSLGWNPSESHESRTYRTPSDLPPDYVPVVSRGLSTVSVLFGGGAGPAEAGAVAKQAAANAAGVW